MSKCPDCRFVEKTITESRYGIPERTYYKCRKNAPQYADSSEPWKRWPAVYEEEWCGCFEAKETSLDAKIFNRVLEEGMRTITSETETEIKNAYGEVITKLIYKRPTRWMFDMVGEGEILHVDVTAIANDVSKGHK